MKKVVESAVVQEAEPVEVVPNFGGMNNRLRTMAGRAEYVNEFRLAEEWAAVIEAEEPSKA